MNQHVGIGMSQQSDRMFNLNTAQPQVAAGNQTMHVVTKAYPNIHLNKSFIPSMSKVMVKRSVWSSGLLLAVAIT